MIVDTNRYTTTGGIYISRYSTELSIETGMEEILSQLDSQRGGLLTSSYEYPGRYKRWAIGFINPPLEIASRDRTFTITAHNDRGTLLLDFLSTYLYGHEHLQILRSDDHMITGSVKETDQIFSEEERSQQPSIFSLIRKILSAFESSEDSHLGLYGPFGYDLVFQFESMPKRLERNPTQKDLLLYLPDELIIIDHYQQRSFRLQYEFETKYGTTQGLARQGEIIDYRGKNLAPLQSSDHIKGEYAHEVEKALDDFRRGDLFEVVPSQSFFESCHHPPTELFRTLQSINPSPYGFIFNLGSEYLVGASPEMFVRKEGRRIETCPISGTIKRGGNAIDDANQILQLLNSRKDESELTMCTDVDRNDKSRICIPGSVRVIGRRQIELYSHLIHTVDHVEGTLRQEFDAIDAFLTHLWAVTVTGAPKRAAMQFIEQNERSPRCWYGGAIGYLTFNGDLNTGLVLRTIRLKDSIAEVRVGATILYDSIPDLEEEETLTKGAALFQTLAQGTYPHKHRSLSLVPEHHRVIAGEEKHVLLIDFEDSFVHTLANYIRQTGVTVTTRRHGFPESILDADRPDLVVLSPGPGTPKDFYMNNIIAACRKRHLPIFGVCLGLQGLVEAYGGTLGVLNYPQHGKTSQIFVQIADSVVFKGLPQSFDVGRYHSLFAQPEHLPADFRVTALSDDGVIMGIEHHTLPISAVQFHPESIMTLAGGVGLHMIQNIVDQYVRMPSTSALAG